jgi:hypothetical protein
MGLSEIAAGIEVTREQRDRGVATVDRTDDSLEARLEPHADDLPCSTAAAATVVDRYAAGASVGAAARAAGIAPMAAAKTLHLLGESIRPLGPTGRDLLRDWLDGRLARSEARQLARASEREFALATYVETHDPLPGARAAVEEALSPVDGSDPLADARSETTDLL